MIFGQGHANSRFIYARNMNPLWCTKILKEKATQFNKPKIYIHINQSLVLDWWSVEKTNLLDLCESLDRWPDPTQLLATSWSTNKLARQARKDNTKIPLSTYLSKHYFRNIFILTVAVVDKESSQKKRNHPPNWTFASTKIKQGNFLSWARVASLKSQQHQRVNSIVTEWVTRTDNDRTRVQWKPRKALGNMQRNWHLWVAAEKLQKQ